MLDKATKNYDNFFAFYEITYQIHQWQYLDFWECYLQEVKALTIMQGDPWFSFQWPPIDE